MTPNRAAAILSYNAHRDEQSWWVKTSREFFSGMERPSAATAVVCSRSCEFTAAEAIAIAEAYVRRDPVSAIATAPSTGLLRD